MENEEIIKLEIFLNRIFFPKHKKVIESKTFGIFKAEVDKVLSGNYFENFIKLKGICPRMEFGVRYKVTCKLAEENEYGKTYQILYSCRVVDISETEKQKQFLSKIINENYVNALFEEYDDVISLLENNEISKLCKIKGIGLKSAERIINTYNESKDYSQIYIELEKLGLTDNFITRLVQHYTSPDIAIDVVKKYPYDLVKMQGVGFKKADEIALKLGVTPNSPERIKAFMFCFLKEQAELGKSYLDYKEIMKAIYDTLGNIPEACINVSAKQMVENMDVLVLDNGNKISLKKYFDLEKYIKAEFDRLKNATPLSKPQPNYIDKIKEIEKEQGFEFTDEQKTAITRSISNNITVITGGAGVGKSTTANGILNLYKTNRILACALSGKAAVRITEATGLPASTIHRALGWIDFKFTYNKENPLNVDIVLIDEATMISGELFLSLLQAIPSGARVIIMGDVQQLAPIGSCQIFADILNSEEFTSIHLTKPHRQALRSGIIPTSIKIANQKPIFEKSFIGDRTIGELQDMNFVVRQTNENLPSLVVEHFQKQLEIYKDIMEVQICVAMRLRGELSCYALNTKIQNILNPTFLQSDDNIVKVKLAGNNKEEKVYTIRKGDKVINTKNNYRAENENGEVVPVFNGNIGIVEDIDEDGYCTINFVGIGKVIFSRAETQNLELAYAITTHKSQGSGFSSVIVALDNSSYTMNKSELLYTAVTRAKKNCTLIGLNSAIELAIKRKEEEKKQTFLLDMLKNTI